jgi:hypothetical protein
MDLPHAKQLNDDHGVTHILELEPNDIYGVTYIWVGTGSASCSDFAFRFNSGLSLFLHISVPAICGC